LENLRIEEGATNQRQIFKLESWIQIGADLEPFAGGVRVQIQFDSMRGTLQKSSASNGKLHARADQDYKLRSLQHQASKPGISVTGGVPGQALAEPTATVCCHLAGRDSSL